MSLTVHVSKYGKPHITFDNYKLRESYSAKNGNVTWHCLGRTCYATIKTDAKKTTS